jgi:hypothetical protein
MRADLRRVAAWLVGWLCRPPAAAARPDRPAAVTRDEIERTFAGELGRTDRRHPG